MKFHRLGGNIRSSAGAQYGMIIKGITQPIIMLFALLLRTFIRRMVWPLSKKIVTFFPINIKLCGAVVYICLFALLVRIISEYDAYSNKYIYFFRDGFIFTKRF